MKKINFKTHWMRKVAALLMVVVLVSSCDKWIDTSINIDPDAPGDVPISLLLPGVEQAIGFALIGNDAVRPTNIWMQLFDGVDRQSFTQARYQLTPADIDNYWGTLYTDALINAQIMLDKAVEQESPQNAGVAKVLIAFSLGIGTDLFGDIPWSDALKGGEGVIQPEYDTQQEIYNTIFDLLDEAISDLGQDDAVGISQDVIYGGDTDAWIAAAYALIAKAHLQLSEVSPDFAAVLSAVDNAISSIDGDMLVPFDAANPNPINQFMVQRTDVRMCGTLFDELDGDSDPRIPFYFAEDENGEYSGSAPTSQTAGASWPGPFLASPTSSTVMISYAEVKFIEAEAAFRSGNAGRALTAYQAGVAASLEQVTGEVDADWMAAHVDGETTGSLTLEKIIMQKRHALVGQLQPFSDWRRTGIPDLALVDGATKTEIPRRFPYSQGELIYNPDHVPSIGSIIDHVWWDQ
jgi:hypothetical protein